ncbi:transcription regulator protein BACH2-like [Trichomycterus rosablanca]|uniref:transcription regulator protein BACH2-like n=1 Tax=Trichomycterus rosablanca TaxID=2290929 RepID=UPI002F351F90
MCQLKYTIMSVDGPRTSVFTFQSALHSVHVLRCLDEQRQKDILCDVTVEVEKRSFRAHCSVLACCSDYFYTRLINRTGWNQVITLPDEVTADGFVPLLQFAYTAKLHFTKENIMEVYRCAELLRFHNLDQACFDFLVPTRSNSSVATPEVKGKSKNSNKSKSPDKVAADNRDCSETFKQCNTTEEDGKTQVPTDETVHNEAVVPSVECPGECPSVSSEKNMPLDLPSVSTEVSTEVFHTTTDHGQTELCLQSCGPQLVPSSIVATDEVCPFLSMPCSSESEIVHSNTVGCNEGILELGETFQNRLAVDAPGETSTNKDLNVPSTTEGELELPLRDLEPSANCSQLCPLSSTETSDVLNSIDSVSSLESTKTDTQNFDPSKQQIFPNPPSSNGITERSMVEREVAEHLAKGFWQEMSSLSEPLEPMDQTTAEPGFLEPTGQTSGGPGSNFHWLKHLDLGAAPDDCPFLRDLSSKETEPSADDTLIRDESRDSFASPINSGENSECDTDEALSNEPVCEVDLPFPVENISSMSRNAFLQLLKEQWLTPEQLEFVHDVRRRSNNRIAAQRSRKKKLDCIHRLEGDIKKLRTQKEKLQQEQVQLKQNMTETQHSLSDFSASVCAQSSVQPEQLQNLSRYFSSDWNSSVLLTPTTSPNLTASELTHTCPDVWSTQLLQPESAHANETDNNNNNNVDSSIPNTLDSSER